MLNYQNSRFVALTFLLLLGSARAADHYVSLNGTNNPPYTNWPDAATSIQPAVTVATNGETVWVSNGTYTISSTIVITNGINVIGTGGVTIVDGNYARQCFSISHSNAVLDGFTITRGYYTADGGGVIVVQGNVQNCIISNNNAPKGGGIAIYNGLVRNSTISYNLATNSSSGYGGGIYARTGLVDSCTIYSNSALRGGGIYFNNYSTAINCRLYGNMATNFGGGAQMLDGVLTLCFISNNVAYDSGGGVSFYYSQTPLITNCTLSQNTTVNRGGGLYVQSAVTGTVANCTISGNKTLLDYYTGGGGGVFIYNSGGIMQNCIISHNMASNGNGGGVTITLTGVVQNCLIEYNTSGWNGGGVAVFYRGSVRNCTIVSNVCATNEGGGFYCYPGTATVQNTIMYFNRDIGSVLHSNWYALDQTSFSNCCSTPELSGPPTNVSGNNTTANPLFSDDFHLLRDSPCINAGANQEWMSAAYDLDGHHRIDIFSRIVDMGCYEYLPSGIMFSGR